MRMKLKQSTIIFIKDFDYDGCGEDMRSIAGRVYEHSPLTQDIVSTRDRSDVAKVILTVGSNRQDQRVNLLNKKDRRNGDCFANYQAFADNKGIIFSPFLMADLFNDKPAGSAIKDNSLKVQAQYADLSKLSNILAKLHYFANLYPGEKIQYEFVDDCYWTPKETLEITGNENGVVDDDVITPLYRFFEQNKWFIPQNVTLTFKHFSIHMSMSEPVQVGESLQGIGPVLSEGAWKPLVKMVAKEGEKKGRDSFNAKVRRLETYQQKVLGLQKKLGITNTDTVARFANFLSSDNQPDEIINELLQKAVKGLATSSKNKEQSKQKLFDSVWQIGCLEDCKFLNILLATNGANFSNLMGNQKHAYVLALRALILINKFEQEQVAKVLKDNSLATSLARLMLYCDNNSKGKLKGSGKHGLRNAKKTIRKLLFAEKERREIVYANFFQYSGFLCLFYKAKQRKKFEDKKIENKPEAYQEVYSPSQYIFKTQPG